MPRRLRLELTEILQLLDRQVVAAQMQQRVEQHRAVPVRHDEAVAIRPLRIGRVVDKKVVPQDFGDIGHRSEEHTSELQSLMSITDAVFCLKKKKNNTTIEHTR